MLRSVTVCRGCTFLAPSWTEPTCPNCGGALVVARVTPLAPQPQADGDPLDERPETVERDGKVYLTAESARRIRNGPDEQDVIGLLRDYTAHVAPGCHPSAEGSC